MTELTNKILDELREQDVRPVPAWRFVLTSVVAWIGFVAFILFGAQAVSIILFLLSDHDWTELTQFRGGRLGYLLVAMPYLWLLALIVLVVVAYLDFKQTKGGYRYRPLVIVGVVVSVSLLAGVGLHAVGLGQRADELMEQNLPHYRMIAPRGLEIWNQPQHGRIIGNIESIEADGTVELRTPNGETWSVQVDPTIIEGIKERLKTGEPMRALGQPGQPGEFKAKAVMPWKDGRSLQLNLRWQQNQSQREELLHPARNKVERSMRPPVHPVAPTE